MVIVTLYGYNCVIEFCGQTFGWQVDNEYFYILLIRFPSSSQPGMGVGINCPEYEDYSKSVQMLVDCLSVVTTPTKTKDDEEEEKDEEDLYTDEDNIEGNW